MQLASQTVDGLQNTACCGFYHRLGYMEMRDKLPPGKGMWPAFWALPSDGTWPPEIDVVEGQGETPSIDYLSFHWRDERKEDNEDETKYDAGTGLSAEFHTYGVDWESNIITWYFDRQPRQDVQQNRFDSAQADVRDH